MKKDLYKELAAPLWHVVTHLESGHLQARKRDLSRHKCASTLIMDYEKINFQHLSHFLYGILLWQPEWTVKEERSPMVYAVCFMGMKA